MLFLSFSLDMLHLSDPASIKNDAVCFPITKIVCYSDVFWKDAPSVIQAAHPGMKPDPFLIFYK